MVLTEIVVGYCVRRFVKGEQRAFAQAILEDGCFAPAPCAQCPVPGAQCPVPSAQCSGWQESNFVSKGRLVESRINRSDGRRGWSRLQSVGSRERMSSKRGWQKNDLTAATVDC